MKPHLTQVALLSCSLVVQAAATVRYVDVNGASPSPPYTNWITAATDIQDAVDVALAGDQVLVTNGVYAGGVAVTTPLALRSVNGPHFTVINGGGTTRCASLTDSGSLSGFTLTNGVAYSGARWGGGVSCTYGSAFLTNCVIVGNSAFEGGGASGVILYDCTLGSNSAVNDEFGQAGVGGGADSCTLYHCALTSNSAGDGGGAVLCTLYNCTLNGNSAGAGGGAWGGTLHNCTLSGNSAVQLGSGAYGGTLYNCTLSSNSAEDGSGAAAGSTLYNCALTGNSGFGASGASAGPTLYNCTVSGNSRGGVSGGSLYNCIVYFNTASGGANYDSSSILNYCCAAPMPTNGLGNIALDPRLASASHLSADSPCRGAGSAAYATGTDIDGELWANPPSIGCDEYHPGAVTGPLTVGLAANYTNVAVGYPVSLTAVIGGRTTDSVWEFGDGDVAINQPYVSHAWTEPGDYLVGLWAFNESHLAGVSATVTIHVVGQPTYYVAATSANPQPPYTSWATAATNIQDAVDAAAVSGTVLVSNGVYASGGRAVDGAITNLIAEDKPLTVRSVNGPQFTVINGRGTNRCAYLTDGASLSGFTLTNGFTFSDGGGVTCTSTNAVLANCVIVGNSGGHGGGAYGGTLYNCTLSGNWGGGLLSSNSYWVGYGGGAYGSALYNCTLNGNLATGSGGGAYGCTLYNCTLTGNSYGGAYGGTLYNCMLSGNSCGAQGSTLYNCTLSGNSSDGADSCTLYNCAVTGNSGLGASGSTLYNCTLTGNGGGGVSDATLYNCIVYFNTAANRANYDSSSSLKYCCTTPLPKKGVGNIVLDPQLASASHLSVDSPCRGAGSAAYATGTDIDVESWGNPPSIGCDEYHAGAVTGPLTVALAANYTSVAVGYPVSFTALIGGQTSGSVWEFGDGDVVINQPYVSHGWTQPGDYLVVLSAFNQNYWGEASVTIHVLAKPVYYVAATNTKPQPPYTSWATAATNIQAAVDAAVPGASVLVSNGVYGMSVAVTNLLTVRSLNGPQFTVIDGQGTNQCVSLADGASLTGFTLTNGLHGVACASTNAFMTNCTLTGNSGGHDGGGARGGTLYGCTLTGNWGVNGGGASGSTLYNCTLAGNRGAEAGGGAEYCALYNCTLSGNSAYGGGGASGSTLINCTLSGNWAYYGGGAIGGTLYNCTLTGNSAYYGGGAYESTLYNCIAYYNTSTNGANYYSSTLNYCCTTPIPTNGSGNISVPPLFVDAANGNLRLQTNSPCINSGNNAYVTTVTDLDGNPRIVEGTVDIGAYEFQFPTSIISYAWLQQYGLLSDGSADFVDSDGDGMNNWQEWISGTNPTNALSVLKMLAPSKSLSGITVPWESVSGITYFLQRSTNPGAQSAFLSVQTNLVGQAGVTAYTDTNPVGAGPFFYRVGIQQ